MSNRKVIELLLQLKSVKADGKNYIKVKLHLVRHLLSNCLSQTCQDNLMTPRIRVFCSHDPFFGSNYFSSIVSGHRNVDLHHR